MKILFVCTGNTCRSPMAQALAADMYGEWEFHSAGVAAYPSPASVHAVAVMAERGLCLAAHASQPVTDELLQSVDLVLALADNHKASLLRDFPSLCDKLYTLGEYTGSDASVADPFGGSLEDYRSCAEQIYGLLAELRKSGVVG